MNRLADVIMCPMSRWFEEYGSAEVYPHLIVGAVPLDANDVQAVADQDVDRVLNLVQDSEYPEDARLEIVIAMLANSIPERRIQLVDFGNVATPALEAAVQQIDLWLDEGHTVYLHCRAGWQRSATVAAGVIAVREDVGIDEALRRLRARKPTADPLPHQQADLHDWWDTRSKHLRDEADA
jgi:protein-tyrosine phosphatase